MHSSIWLINARPSDWNYLHKNFAQNMSFQHQMFLFQSIHCFIFDILEWNEWKSNKSSYCFLFARIQWHQIPVSHLGWQPFPPPSHPALQSSLQFKNLKSARPTTLRMFMFSSETSIDILTLTVQWVHFGLEQENSNKSLLFQIVIVPCWRQWNNSFESTATREKAL